MPGLSYPFVYECSGCGNETTVTREDAHGLYPGPDSSNAAEVVLEQREKGIRPSDRAYSTRTQVVSTVITAVPSPVSVVSIWPAFTLT